MSTSPLACLVGLVLMCAYVTYIAAADRCDVSFLEPIGRECKHAHVEVIYVP